MRYGLPYQGSKNAIAKWVIDHLPPAHILVDAFAGGCAITHAALLSGKYEKIIANDINGAPQIFLDAINGEYEGYSYVPDREEYRKEKENDFVIALLYSFGNKTTSYLWSEELEPVKVEASRMISAPSMHERRVHYKKFIDMLSKYALNDNNLEGLQRLERIQSLQDLQRLERIQSLQISNCDYRQLEIQKGSIVYCDIPYRDKCCEGYEGFDFEAFDDWINNQESMVIVSEYTAPRNCVSVAEIEKVSLMDSQTRTQMKECLFVQERFADTYNQAMKQGTLLEYMED